MDDESRAFANDRFAHYLGIELLEAGEGHAKASLRIRPDHCYGIHIAHGGAIFSLADLTFAVAANSRETVAVAINASISFMRPATEGMLIAEARETALTHRLGTYTVDVTDESGELVAIFQGMAYRKRELVSEAMPGEPTGS